MFFLHLRIVQLFSSNSKSHFNQGNADNHTASCFNQQHWQNHIVASRIVASLRRRMVFVSPSCENVDPTDEEVVDEIDEGQVNGGEVTPPGW